MKKFKDVIIVDENNKPMAWSENDKQLVNCTDDQWQDEPTPVETYTVKKAQRLIEKSIANRKKWKLTVHPYKTMPFNYPFRKKYVFPNSRSTNS